MSLFLTSALRGFPAPLKLFLLFTAVNVISWQCIVGQALVLFARALDMPPSLVGLLISFMPLSMLLVVLAYPLVEWMGSRKLLMVTWLSRNIIMLPVFFIPWAMEQRGPEAGWHVLIFVTLAFSLIRAVGVGGWYPWLHEIVPRYLMGTYLSTETAASQLINILLAFGMARILASGEGTGRFFWIYAVGVGSGLLSVFLIGRIPGGAAIPSGNKAGLEQRPALGKALADREYIHFLFLTAAASGALMWLNAASVMYLRDVLRYTEGHIMLLLACGGVWVALTVRFWGRVADRFGSVPAMIQLLLAHGIFAAGWLALLPGKGMTAWLALPVLVFSLIFNAAFTMVSARGMLCRVRNEGRVGYTTLWIISVSLANGVPPVLAGLFIDYWGLAGFRLCFGIAWLASWIAAAFMFRLPQEEGKPPIDELHHLIRPSQPMRSIGRIFWITLGLDEKTDTDDNWGKDG